MKTNISKIQECSKVKLKMYQLKIHLIIVHRFQFQKGEQKNNNHKINKIEVTMQAHSIYATHTLQPFTRRHHETKTITAIQQREEDSRAK